MNDPILCEGCGAKNTIINDIRENICVCTGCGVVQRKSQPPRIVTYATSVASKIVEPWHLAGQRVELRGLQRAAVQAHRLSLTKAQTRMLNLTKKIDSIVEKLHCCARVSDRATRIMFTMLNTSSLKRIKKDELLCSVALMFAAREARIHYTFREIAGACENVSRKEICRVFKIYERIISKLSSALKIDVDPVKFSPMIPRFGSRLGLDFLQQKKVRFLFSQINGSAKLSTLNPLTRLAVAIFKTMGETKQNCDDVSIVCSVSAHTIIKSSELVTLVL